MSTASGHHIMATNSLPERPTPALTFVGRKNSGKTTLLVALVAELTRRGVDVATLKHHGHPDFEMDVPGKDSFLHHAAGATASAVLSSKRFGLVADLKRELGITEALAYLPGHDIVLVEGFRRNGVIPSVELFRAASERDMAAKDDFIAALGGAEVPGWEKLPVAVVTDLPDVKAVAETAGIPSFPFDDVAPLADFVQTEHARPKLTVAIQAGGESRRMGQSKALVPFLGRPLIVTLCERLAPIADELLITTNEPERLTFLEERFPGVRLVTDIHPTRGALPGMHTALSRASQPFTALVACDMVAASASLIAAEAMLLRDQHRDAVCPRTRHGIEPFAGVYRTDACLAATEAALREGKKRMVDVLERVNTLGLEKGNPFGVNFPLGCFLNTNTPDELAFAERLLG
jgi:molybdopterin-guanine dinucleotide biosynthesis protein MobB